MTVTQFRRMALSLSQVEERGHMDHPDFRVRGKIFATLGYPDKSWGMVKLTPEQQRIFVQANPGVFVPAAGSWGLQGSTLVRLKTANADTVAEAMTAAWLGRAPKKLAKRSRRGTSRSFSRLGFSAAAAGRAWLKPRRHKPLARKSG
jgi:hypothetical protein